MINHNASSDRAHLMESLARAISRITGLERTLARLRAENADLRAEIQAHMLLSLQQENELDRLKTPIAEPAGAARAASA